MDTKIKQLVQKAEIGRLKGYSWLGNGFSSHAYEINTDRGSYVLLETKKDAVEETSYKTYFANLRCLEKCHYSHAPRAIYVSNDGRALLITRVSGTVVTELEGLSANERKTVAMNITNSLLELQMVKPQDLRQELKSLGLPMPEPFTEEKDWETYVINTFYPYKDLAPEDAQAKWLEAQIVAYKPVHNTGKDIMFHHGDTSGPNVLIGKDWGVNLIDWGGAGFYASSQDHEDYGLAYTMNHIDIMAEYREDIIQYVAQKQGVSDKSLASHIFTKQKDIKIADIAWAFMMYAKATHGKTEEKPEVFKKILDTRIEEYKATFL